MDDVGDPEELSEGLRHDLQSRPVAEWMVEASLPTIPDAIILFLDGGPSFKEAAHMFREVI